jgi:hypothetical protein
MYVTTNFILECLFCNGPVRFDVGCCHWQILSMRLIRLGTYCGSLLICILKLKISTDLIGRKHSGWACNVCSATLFAGIIINY